MKKVTELMPRELWGIFDSLTQIPRPSKHEDAVANYIVDFAKKHELEAFRDKAGNVIIRKHASEGMEDRRGIILQGHLDMVPQKNKDKKHDFITDPITTIVENGIVRADGTTLGADDGIGVAAALAVMTDKSLVHGPLEALLTIDEETGMTGANKLEPNMLDGQILLNLDSEEEGEICIGCAGGLDVNAKFHYTPVETAEEDIALEVVIGGLRGGHSGIDINMGRANANKLLVRFLKFAAANYEAMLAKINGGNMRNAIPREASAVLTIDSEDREDFLEAIEEFEEMLRTEYADAEPDLSLTCREVERPATVIDEMTADDVINAVQGCINGVIRMSTSVNDLVETSLNLAIINTNDDNTIDVSFLLRSLVESAKDDIASSVESIFRLAGAEVEFSGAYPGWRPNADSEVLKTASLVYQRLFDKKPVIRAIHAGLECGIMGGVYPKWDMISFGPTIRHPHSPDENVDIASVERFWTFLTELIRVVK